MTDVAHIREKVKKHFLKIVCHEDIYRLFTMLGYPNQVIFDSSYIRKKESFNFNKDDFERIKEIYSILSFGEGLSKGDKLPIFLIESTTLVPSFIRSVTKKFSDTYLRFMIIFTTDYKQIVFVFPDYEKIEVGVSKLIITKLLVDKEDIHYTDVEILSNIVFENEKNWRDVWRKWKKAFSVERVTKNFFEDYKNIFFKLREYVIKKDISQKNAHEFTLQLLNRIMFIYFISKKDWVGNKKFIEWLWREYKLTHEKNLFYENWLKQIFLKAFNNRGHEIKGLSINVRNVALDAPFLNGGLFNKNKLDDLPINIDDSLMNEIIFHFFEKYNFTIREDMPLDKEVAVDPEMIGYVYESLANVAEEIYDRTDLGIFYTPRVEVHFMCGRAIVEFLSKHISDIPKEKFYYLIFDPPEAKEHIEEYFKKEDLWDELEECLDNLSIVDPACGSGAFLVGMLNILIELYSLIYKHKKVSLTDFELKNRIIGKSLYGVDVMPWAIHAAELRLWLQLIVGTEFKKEELRKHALLPNLNMNLRVGDSLVQEIGGINFHLRDGNISDKLKRKLYNLKIEKEKYFNNDITAKFKSKGEIEREELHIFNEIIKERIDSLNINKEKLENSIEKLKKTKQKNIFGEVSEKEQQKIINERDDRKNLLNQVFKDLEELEQIKIKIKEAEHKPFIWDIDFAEIFGDKGGFDIVIGNPPYVRQEKISPPNKTKIEVTKQDIKKYKENLRKSVKTQFPFISKIDKKSDYYIYFYFHGLGLIHEKGIFCFITSNSWLDVGYGKNLQEFLLKYVPIIAIYDNPKRSFAHAGINTIIVLFGHPNTRVRIEKWLYEPDKNLSLNNTAKFIMFKKSFEEVINSKNLIEIDNIEAKLKGDNISGLVDNIINTSDYRIFPISQEDLLEDGWEYPEGYDSSVKERFKVGKYQVNKWGGKFLRAPDIFYKILEKGKEKFVQLDNISEVKRGYTTGANEFFYLDEETRKKWGVETAYLKPAIMSPRESKKIDLSNFSPKFNVLLCHENKKNLEEKNVLNYIDYGENKEIEIKSGSDKGKKIIGFNNLETTKNRKRWYDLGSEELPDLVWNYLHNDNTRVFYNGRRIFINNVLYGIRLKNQELSKISCLLQNSTLNVLITNIFGRMNYGEGALSLAVFEVKKIPVLNPNNFIKYKETLDKIFNEYARRDIVDIFSECGIDFSKPIREQEPKPLSDRKELDDIIFNELELNEVERKEVYWCVCELIKQRLDKASSLKSGT